MKTAIAAIAVTLALAGSAFSQTKSAKIGDAYGVAAMRYVIAVSNSKPDAIKAPLLDELQAQISSSAEQANYDGISSLDDVFYHNAPPMLSDDDRHVRSVLYHSCLVAVKANLKRRDGIIPQECMAPTK